MRDRLATESVEEREARLQQMSTRQRERLATESAEEREARLYHTDSMPIVDMSSNASSCTITADLLNWHLSFGLLRLAPQCLLVIGASVSEPHTSGYNAAFSLSIYSIRQRGPGGPNSSRAAACQYPLHHTRRARVAAPALANFFLDALST